MIRRRKWSSTPLLRCLSVIAAPMFLMTAVIIRQPRSNALRSDLPHGTSATPGSSPPLSPTQGQGRSPTPTHFSDFQSPPGSPPPADGPIPNGTAAYYAIWIGGLSRGIKEQHLIGAFSPYAKTRAILSVHIVRQDRPTIGADDLGFVNFHDEEDAIEAYKALVNGTIAGKKIKLKPPRRKLCNLTQIQEFKMQMMDNRPDPNIPLNTKHVRPYWQPSGDRYQSRPPPLGRGNSYRQPYRSKTNFYNQIADMRISRPPRPPHMQTGGRKYAPKHPQWRKSAFNLNRSWLGEAVDMAPYYAETLVSPSASMANLIEARNRGVKHVVEALNKGMTTQNNIPYISVEGCPSWVPSMMLSSAMDRIRGPTMTYNLVLYVGSPSMESYELECEVLNAIEGVKDLLVAPIIPLLPANRLDQPNMRPNGYLLTLKPAVDCPPGTQYVAHASNDAPPHDGTENSTIQG